MACSEDAPFRKTTMAFLLLISTPMVDANWRRLSNDIEYFISDSTQSPVSAASVCENMDSLLVSINDAAENALVTSAADSYNYWIGVSMCGSSICADEDLRWADGSPLTYKNVYETDGINLGSGSAMYLSSPSGNWGTIGNRRRYRYICERQLPAVCMSSPCLNGGTCQRDDNDAYAYNCQCLTTFDGPQCQNVLTTTGKTQ